MINPGNDALGPRGVWGWVKGAVTGLWGSPNVAMKRKVHFEESGPYQLIQRALNPRKSEDGAGLMKEF